jgi:hypothetical protein
MVRHSVARFTLLSLTIYVLADEAVLHIVLLVFTGQHLAIAVFNVVANLAWFDRVTRVAFDASYNVTLLL